MLQKKKKKNGKFTLNKFLISKCHAKGVQQSVHFCKIKS